MNTRKEILISNYDIQEKSNIIADTLCSKGFSKIDDAFNPNKGLFSKAGTSNLIGVSRTSAQAAFAVNGTVGVSDYNGIFDGLVMEIASSLTDEFGLSRYFPDTMLPAVDQIFVDFYEGAKGLALDYLYGAEVPEVRKLANGTYSYEVPVTREQRIFTEQDILFLRELGNSNLSARGILQQIAVNSLEAYVRMLNKKKYNISSFVFSGLYSFSPATGTAPITISSGADAANTLLPVGAPWGIAGTGVAAGTIVPNPAANPVLDLQYWFSTASALKRLLAYVNVMVMSPNTEFLLLQNANTQAYINRILANNSVIQRGDSYNFQRVAEIAIPTARSLEVIVDYTGYVDDTTDVFNYFIPDGYIMFGMEIPNSYGSQLGDFVYIGQVQNGGFANPQPGPFIVLEDNTYPGSRGGLIRPQLNLVSGFAGGVRLKRPHDLVIAKVI